MEKKTKPPCLESDFVVCCTKDGYYLRVACNEIPTRGRSAGGVKLIGLTENDELTEAYCGSVKDEFLHKEQLVPFTKIKIAKRGAKGIKMRSFN